MRGVIDLDSLLFQITLVVLGKNEEAYIMDAKVIGNLGRYMNHSCRPNVFVQNVFVSIFYSRCSVAKRLLQNTVVLCSKS